MGWIYGYIWIWIYGYIWIYMDIWDGYYAEKGQKNSILELKYTNFKTVQIKSKKYVVHYSTGMV